MKVKITKTDMTPEFLKELQGKQLSFVAQGGQEIRTEMVMRCISKQIAGSVQVNEYVTDGGAESETGCATDSKVPFYIEYGTGKFAEHGDGRKELPWTYYSEEMDQFFTTYGMHAQPFAQPGFDAAKPGIDRLAETVLRV